MFILSFSLGVAYIALQLGLADSSYTASTVYGGWATKYMKLDSTALMGWKHTLNDPNPWIQVDMLNTYTIVGLYLQRDPGFYLITYNLKASVDGNSYNYIEKDILAEFVGDALETTYWFANATNGRYWRIEPLTHAGDSPMVRGDFVHYV